MNVPLAPTFRPSREEFADSLAYITGLVKKGVAKQYGIIKIIPPPDFINMSKFHDLTNVSISPRIQVLSELSLKNKSLLYSVEKRSLMANQKKRRKLKWDSITCQVCSKAGDDSRLLLCDGCDAAYHTYCLTPSLTSVPRGEWFCPQCRNTRMSGGHGFEHTNERYSLQDFAERARIFKANYFGKHLKNVSVENVEREFWSLVACSPYDEANRVVVEYGADLSNITAFNRPQVLVEPHSAPCQDEEENDEEEPYASWNLNKLPVHRESALRFIKGDISGMKSPWCYAGTCFSCFCWHVEDHWTYSINYNHYGDAKTWYGVPADDAVKLERALRAEAPAFFDKFPTLMHNLNTMLNPEDAQRAGVRICKAFQFPGEFMVTFPRAYHAGFNQGFNFAEAVNFCPPDWLFMGRRCMDSYRHVGRACVFSHAELCFTIAQTCERLSVNFLTAVLQELDALLQQMHSDLHQPDIAKLGFDVRRACVDAALMRADDEGGDGRTCFKCKTLLYEMAVSCVCAKGKMSCVSHCVNLCPCAVDNRRKRLYMSHSLSEWTQLREKVFHRLTGYRMWRCQVRHLASSWRVAMGLKQTPVTHDEEDAGGAESCCSDNTDMACLDTRGGDVEGVDEAPPLLEMMELPTEEEPPPLVTGEGDQAVENEAPALERTQEEEDAELVALDRLMVECGPFQQPEKMVWTMPDGEDLSRKRTHKELLELCREASISSYPQDDRVMLEEMLSSMEIVMQRVARLVKPLEEEPTSSWKIEIHDFMCLLHQMREMPFDFEYLHTAMETLCGEVERVQHAVLDLETEVNATLKTPHSLLAEETLKNLLHNLQERLTSATRLRIKIHGLSTLEEKIPILKWLLSVKMSSSGDTHALQQLIRSGETLPQRDVVVDCVRMLHQRLQQLQHLNLEVKAILNSSDGSKAPLDAALRVLHQVTTHNLVTTAVEDLRAAILSAQQLQTSLQAYLQHSGTSGSSCQASLAHLQELILSSERLIFLIPEVKELQERLLHGLHVLSSLEELFFGNTSMSQRSVEERENTLLKVVLPRPVNVVHHLKTLNGGMEQSRRGCKSTPTNSNLWWKSIAAEEMTNVRALVARFTSSMEGGGSVSEEVVEMLALMGNLEKTAMLQLREENRRKSETTGASPRYCLCSQAYDESQPMVECELCAEWYHDQCLEDFHASGHKASVIKSLARDTQSVHNFLCPLCQRSQRPPLNAVETLVQRWNCVWPGAHFSVLGVALGAMLQQVQHYQNKVQCFVEVPTAGPLLAEAWRHCLHLFQSTPPKDNKKPTLRSLRSQNATDSASRSVPSSVDTGVRVFKTKDLQSVKSLCSQWLASTEQMAIDNLISQLETLVVEGNLLEMFSAEAKALALLLQMVQAVLSEKENTAQVTPVEKEVRTGVASRRGQMVTAAATEKESAESSTKAKLRSSAPKRVAPLKQEETICEVSPKKRRSTPKPSRRQASPSPPSQSESHSSSASSPIEKRISPRRRLVSSPPPPPSSPSPSHSSTSSSSVNSITVRHLPPHSQGVTLRNGNTKESRSGPTSSRRRRGGRQNRKKENRYVDDLIAGGLDEDLLSSSSDESEDECAMGRGCVIHDKRRVRQVLWVQCDKCLCWYHYMCVGIRAGATIQEEYICSTCLAAVNIFQDTVESTPTSPYSHITRH